METYDTSKFPLFNEDNERNPPPEVVEFKRKIREADAILFASPEYNFSIPAVLKNAIEWGNQPDEDNAWEGKAAAIVSASTSPRGGARAQAHLRQIMVDLNMHPINTPQLYIARAQEAFDSDLNLVDPRYRKYLEELLQALSRWALKIRG